MKQLPVIKLKPVYYDAIEKRLNEYFYQTFYRPIGLILKKYDDKIFNASSPLITALLKGKTQYVDNKFTGTFSASISKELIGLGAKYSKARKTWFLPMDDLPMDIRVAIGSARSMFIKMHTDVSDYLDQVDIDDAMGQLHLDGVVEQAVHDMEGSFSSAQSVVGVLPTVTPDMVKVITDEYVSNMDLYIKSWTEKNIEGLRQTVVENTFSGYRAETLVKDLRANYQVSKNKAKFLARQETSLLVSKYREERYKSAGVNQYKWSTSGDSRVRDRHQHLNNKVFSWDNPPVIDDNGNTGNPGEAFGCRCVAIPLV